MYEKYLHIRLQRSGVRDVLVLQPQEKIREKHPSKPNRFILSRVIARVTNLKDCLSVKERFPDGSCV